MVYYCVVFGPECISNAFTNDPSLLRQFILERKRLISHENVNMVYQLECDSYSEFIKRASEYMDICDAGNEIVLLEDDAGSVTYTGSEVMMYDFSPSYYFHLAIIGLYRSVVELREYIYAGILCPGDSDILYIIQSLMNTIYWYGMLESIVNDISPFADGKKEVDQFLRRTKREYLTQQYEDIYFVDIVNLSIVHRDFLIDLINNNGLPFDEDDPPDGRLS